jgi:hypothetical protein
MAQYQRFLLQNIALELFLVYLGSIVGKVFFSSSSVQASISRTSASSSMDSIFRGLNGRSPFPNEFSNNVPILPFRDERFGNINVRMNERVLGANGIINPWARAQAVCNKKIRILNGVTIFRKRGRLVKYVCSQGFR